MKNEDIIQMVVVRHLKTHYPAALFTISPSGMRLPIGVARKFKMMGYRAGTPDLLIFEPKGNYHGLFIELKSEGGRASPEQKMFSAELIQRGYCCMLCFGAATAIYEIDRYMKL